MSVNEKIPTVSIPVSEALSFEQMKKLDYYTVDNYHLPIELMMENAGLNLAKLTSVIANPNDKILIGIGTGNNGGGGLVAARRLKAWGFDVYLDIPIKKINELPSKQLERALSFGSKQENIEYPDIFIDAYLGFSQKPPLKGIYSNSVKEKNKLTCKKISLDIPTGFFENSNDITEFFKPDFILSLAFPKKVLYNENLKSEIFIADLGIPESVYKKFNFHFNIPFKKNTIFKLKINI